MSQKDDLISRQAAIDIERRATVDTNPEHFESHQKFVEFMDNAEISSFGRWQWSNGFNTALTAVGIDLEKLPSAEPERKTGKWVGVKEYCDHLNEKAEREGKGHRFIPSGMNDLISRKAVLKGISLSCTGQSDVIKAEAALVQYVEKIPSAEQKEEQE